ncbi:hypothetical protein Scep_009282 [Stephania cephalantha]|uniref:Protein kinase domain-containing protein n=1 Tax=Stephania cephalantha TaxID=152367 RepID=A0AAP0PG47_9MAGN
MEARRIGPFAEAAPPYTLLHHHHLQHLKHHHTHHGLPTIILIIIISAISVAILVTAFLLILMLCRSKPAKNNARGGKKNNSSNSSRDDYRLNSHSIMTIDASPEIEDVKSSCLYGGSLGLTPQSRRKGVQVFAYKELQLATQGFREANLIGHGRFGVVYKGVLSDGTVAAINILHKEGKQGEREFRTEVDLMSRLHSPYLVGLLGYCADQHHRILISEFMPNGSLQRYLHPFDHEQHRQPLNWGTRLRIALDCARALEFLHEHAVPPVIHRDFKCSNILLDHNFRAKVSDLGSAKTGSEKINGQTASRVLGTTGYLAPEYATTGRLTTKSDVYSYGVVLLELLTGRAPVDAERPPGEHVLVSWALPRLTNREKVEEMVDPVLQGQYSRKELIQVAAIAAVCVQQEADYRPFMTDVVQSLIPLVRSFSTTFPSTSSKRQRPATKP